MDKIRAIELWHEQWHGKDMATTIQLDHQLESAEIHNASQHQVAGVQSAPPRQNTRALSSGPDIRVWRNSDLSRCEASARSDRPRERAAPVQPGRPRALIRSALCFRDDGPPRGDARDRRSPRAA